MLRENITKVFPIIITILNNSDDIILFINLPVLIVRLYKNSIKNITNESIAEKLVKKENTLVAANNTAIAG
ncbi:MAG: hypothetical protein IJA55_02720 [Clostridia bacterium]|nr:hypothetical protein [Clostridia bacterium]